VAANPRQQGNRSALDRSLGLLAEVHAGEGARALLLAFTVFVLLGLYYLLKPVRETLILSGGGAEVKSYSSAGQAVLLIGVVWIYGRLGRLFGPMKLLTGVFLFFAANLVIFYVLALAELPLGIPFFLWLGVFNVFVIAQFWAFANDIYTPEQGKRLFAIVGIGASVGAVAGSQASEVMLKVLDAYWMMPISAVLLLVCLGLVWIVQRSAQRDRSSGGAPKQKEEPLGKEGGFAMIARDRYLLLIAALILLLNFVNTNGEYILDRSLLPAATAAFRGRELRVYCDAIRDRSEAEIVTAERAMRRAGETLPEIRECNRKKFASKYIGVFKANYFKWVNLIGAFLQLFVVSRIFKYLGVRRALFFLPLISLAGSSMLAVAPVLAFIRVAKIGENSTDYSLMNTTKQALWLLTSREAKYKAKAAIDTFIVRIGDLASAGLVAVGSAVALSTKGFVVTNIALVLAWLGVAWGIAREHKRRSDAAESVPPTSA
jgi:AAA family ATP:ADP antiporter